MCECNLENLDGLKGLEFESLEVLALYGNKIEEVKSVFCSGDDGEETRKKPAFQNLKRLMLNENKIREIGESFNHIKSCLLYTSPSPRDYAASRMPSSA